MTRLRIRTGMLALLFLASPAVAAPPAHAPAAATPAVKNPIVDLHAHIFFYEGAGIRLFGSFDSPIEARDWSDRLYTKVNADVLEKSPVAIAVIALYSHPLFLNSERESVRQQIRAAEAFVKSHPDWVIARSATEARNAIRQGKRALIYSIEGISGIIENDEDIHEFVDEDGVRIITPLHFTDDEFGGAAFMPGIDILANPWAAVKSVFSSWHDVLGVKVNPEGLKPRGREMIEKLVQRGVWIDLSHSSDASQRDIIPILRQAQQPLLYTHTIMREAMRAERGISPSQLEDVKKAGGIIGILPSDDMLRGTQAEPRFCPALCDAHCHGGTAAFLTQYSQAVQALGAGSVMIGSDIDAPLTFLKPSCPAQASANPQGMWNYAQLSELFRLIQAAKLAPPGPDSWMIDRFLDAWGRLETALHRSDQG